MGLAVDLVDFFAGNGSVTLIDDELDEDELDEDELDEEAIDGGHSRAATRFGTASK